jgi:hypothetical protein
MSAATYLLNAQGFIQSIILESRLSDVECGFEWLGASQNNRHVTTSSQGVHPIKARSDLTMTSQNADW